LKRKEVSELIISGILSLGGILGVIITKKPGFAFISLSVYLFSFHWFTKSLNKVIPPLNFSKNIDFSIKKIELKFKKNKKTAE